MSSSPSFNNIATQLMNCRFASKSDYPYIPREEYDNFCKEFIFAKLKDDTLGKAFCRTFNIIDYVLLLSSNDTFSMTHIEDKGYIGTPRDTLFF